MNILVVGAGGVGSSIAAIAERRSFFDRLTVADISLERAQAVVDHLDDRRRFGVARVDASSPTDVVETVRACRADVIVNACDPRLNVAIFSAALAARCAYIDMAMSLSSPHLDRPYEETGVKLGDDQFAMAEQFEAAGLLALVGMGIEPGLSDVFARYAADHLFDEIDEIGVRDGSNLSIDGYEFAPTFSIWTTIEECLNPPIIWEKGQGWFTTECFSEPEVFHFPAGIGPVECVNVEHEEVLLVPRWVDCNRVTFKYGLGADFIEWLKTFAYLGLDSKDKIKVGSVEVAPRDVLAAVLPNPAELGHLMHGKTCAGTWVKGTYDSNPREVYLYHVADNAETMREYGNQAVVWQTAVNPVVALELLANGAWHGSGVLGPEAFDAVPFLNLLAEYGSHHGMVEMGAGYWPGAVRREPAPVQLDRPVVRPPRRAGATSALQRAETQALATPA
jgi:saccharopine dehydrogenase-like NADP-dependent oxidoreductase